ncbi:MAG: GNAT family N-acetyltransferase [Chitinophagales bacterium]|nr:GNAT family N-acetyltransferase [Chitinophagales bacterium]
MTEPGNIQYLSHQQIDKTKWDRCIDNAGNGLIYAYSFYLDQMAKHWDALVLNDYEAVMPLSWNKKYGICYLYQPFLTAQLGIFGRQITGEMVSSFINSIPRKFRLVEIALNHANTGSAQVDTQLRMNYVLDLNHPIEFIQQQYRENIRRNIKKSLQAGCSVTKDFAAEKVIELALQQMKGYDKDSAENVERLRKLYQLLHAKKMATTYGITLNKEIVASCVFFFSHQRAYYILVGNHPNGKTIGASHALIDAFIQDHAGKNILLDFEGSDIPNLAFFYSSFGAKEEKYPFLQVNKLPFYLKWLKR